MENPKIALKQIISDDVISIDKIKCSKCGGAGNLKHLKILEELA